MWSSGMTSRGSTKRQCFRPFFRSVAERVFSARHKAFVRELHIAVAGWIGGQLARFIDPSPSALSRRARQVLRCLLDGDGDKQIARRLGISHFTVNQYAKVIFEHFGVSSRPELLARWVRRGWGKGFAWDNE